MSARLERRVLAKIAAYTITPPQDRAGLTFTNRGAVGSVTVTLPVANAGVKGWWYDLLVHADQSLILAGAAAGKIVTFGNAAADNVGFQIASKKIGGRILAICDGTQWFCIGVRAGGGFCVNGTEVALDDSVTAGVVTASRGLVVDATKQLAEGLLFLFGTGTNNFKPQGIMDAQASAAGVGNGADATDDTLFTKTLKGNSFNVAGDAIRVRMCGVTAANGQNKRVKVFFGATAVIDSGVITSNAKNWWAEVVVRMTGAGAQIAFGSFGVDGVADVVTKTTPAETETGDIVVKGTGSSPTSSSANDIKGHDWQIEALPL